MLVAIGAAPAEANEVVGGGARICRITANCRGRFGFYIIAKT
jgi:hypothetical protein